MTVRGRDRSRAVQLVVACTVASVATLGPWAATADAAGPVRQGWWTEANAGRGVSLPGPSDVPARGLLVQGGTGSKSGTSDGGPFAFSALVYTIGNGMSADTLTLVASASSGTNPASTLELCPLESSTWTPVQGGAMGKAPGYSCRSNATAAASGGKYRFKVADLVTNGDLAVAVLPTSPVDRVVLTQPDADSLTVGPNSPAAGTTVPSGAGFGGQPAGGSAVPTPASSGGGGSGQAGPSQAGPGGGTQTALAGGAQTSGSGPSSGTAPDVASPPTMAAPSPTGSSGHSSAQAAGAPAGTANASFDVGHHSSGGPPWAAFVALAALVAAGVSWLAAGRSAEQHALDDEPQPGLEAPA